MKKIFSVIILHYNQPDYWKTAVDSVISQDYPAIQLIFSDDGSVGFSCNEVREYIDSHKKKNIIDVKIICHHKNLGIVKTLNGAYNQCQGTYVLQFAADDALYSAEVLSQFAAAINAAPSNVLGVFARSLDCDENLKWNGKEYISPEQAKKFTELSADEQYRRIIYRCLFHLGATAFLNDKLKIYLPLDDRYYLIEDWPLALRVTRNGEKFFFSDFKALLYRAGGVSRPLKERDFSLTRHICQDHLGIFERDILPYSKMLKFCELRDMMEKYDKDRAWMKEMVGEFESKKRIEILKKDWRLTILILKMLIQYCHKVLLIVGGCIFLNYIIVWIGGNEYFKWSILFDLVIFSCLYFGAKLKDILRMLKRYLFSPFK